MKNINALCRQKEGYFNVKFCGIYSNNHAFGLFGQPVPKESDLNRLLTRQAIHIQHNFEVRSCNHCCSGKAVSVKYFVCVCSLTYPTCKAYASHYHLWPV